MPQHYDDKPTDPDLKASEEQNSKWEDYYTEATTSLSGLVEEFKRDFRYYLGDQWEADLKKILDEKKVPALVFNYIKKQCDVVSGAQRQNATQLAAFPIDGGDVAIADVLTKVMIFVAGERNSKLTVSSVFKDGVIGGLGWLLCRMSYKKDPKYGDIVFEKVSPIDVYPDPHYTRTDLEDAQYLIHKKQLPKGVCKVLWPHKAGEIEKLKSENESDGYTENPSIANERGVTLNVVEYWYKEYNTVKTVVDLTDPGNTADWEGDEIENGKRQIVAVQPNAVLDDLTDDQLLTLLLELNPNLDVVNREQTKIKLRIEIEKTVEVYDGESPREYDIDEYNFIPWFAFFDSSFGEWARKVQGVVRQLRDPQDERNKRRSNFIQQQLSMPSTGWMVQEGAVNEVEDYRNGGGAGGIFYYNRGSEPPIKMPPTEIPQGLIALDQLAEADFNRIGPNADVLGQMSQGGEPGIVVQLRQKQGMQALQEIFDNHSGAMITLGRIMLKLITKWPAVKIKRILGDDAPHYIGEEEKEQNLKAISLAEGTLAGLQQQEINEETNQQIIQLSEELEQLTQVEKERAEAEDEFWEKYDKLRKTARFDIKVDEITNSPTARMSTRMQLTEMQQYGMQIPPEILMEYSEMDVNTKQQFNQINQQNQQLAEQQAQTERQKVEIEQQVHTQNVALENKKLEFEMVKLQAEMQQDAREHEFKMAKTSLEMQKLNETPEKPLTKQ